MNIKESVLTTVAAIGGTALLVIFVAFGALSLPLAIVSMMRWFDYEWWSALIVLFLIQALPGIGQLFTLVSAL